MYKNNLQAIRKSELKEYFENNNIKINENIQNFAKAVQEKAQKPEGLEDNYIELEELMLDIKQFRKIRNCKEGIAIITKDNIEEMLNYMNILLFRSRKEMTQNTLDMILRVNKAIKQYKSNCNVEMLLDNLFLDIYDMN